MRLIPRKKRKRWNRKTRETHDKLDIDQYLSEVADRFTIDQDLIDEYKENHQNREYDPRKRRYRSRYVNYSHGSNPFCKICDEDFVIGEEAYGFMLSRNIGVTFYHVECFKGARESRQRAIIYQDRAYKRKNPPEEPEEVVEFYKPLREESWKLYEELRKEQGPDDK